MHDADATAMASYKKQLSRCLLHMASPKLICAEVGGCKSHLTLAYFERKQKQKTLSLKLMKNMCVCYLFLEINIFLIKVDVIRDFTLIILFLKMEVI